ncbi:hypothetical protein [Lutibacter sp. TH_r2]|uniref:hypothetical protein n=1 Tax=Lutibacter sp. TH_r2 TaxID=3082083 RepID=UPI002954C7FB|nr:hypothetical protein [Lutibacter sp. TH_r2]
MEKQYYTCQFCQEEFIPKRRKVQKFCSDTCRNKNHYHKNNNVKKEPIEILNEPIEAEEKKKNKVEEMSTAGIGNAALGSLTGIAIVELLKKFLTSFENKTATKGDIENLLKGLNQRYFPVVNVAPRFNKSTYYDKQTGKIVFYDKQTQMFELPIMDLQ